MMHACFSPSMMVKMLNIEVWNTFLWLCAVGYLGLRQEEIRFRGGGGWVGALEVLH